MKTTKRPTAVSEIKTDPNLRISFMKEHHQNFVDFCAVAETYKLHPSVLMKHISLCWLRKFKGAPDDKAKSLMVTEITQSIHGLWQIDGFIKPEEWENIDESARNRDLRTVNNVLDKAGITRTTAKKRTAKPKPKPMKKKGTK